MIKSILLAMGLVTGLASCATAPPTEPEPTGPFGWLTGCWQNEDGSIREVWSAPEGSHLFGYSVYLKDGQSTFFEQIRIDLFDPPVFNAYPAGQGPSPFPMVEQSAVSATFLNSEHDYPQRIRYQRDGDALNAVISLADGSKPGTFSYVRCPAE